MTVHVVDVSGGGGGGGTAWAVFDEPPGFRA